MMNEIYSKQAQSHSKQEKYKKKNISKHKNKDRLKERNKCKWLKLIAKLTKSGENVRKN